MIHRTFRSLDEPPKLLGFTATQWCWLIADLAGVLALVLATGMPAKAAITLLAFTVGCPRHSPTSQRRAAPAGTAAGRRGALAPAPRQLAGR